MNAQQQGKAPNKKKKKSEERDEAQEEEEGEEKKGGRVGGSEGVGAGTNVNTEDKAAMDFYVAKVRSMSLQLEEKKLVHEASIQTNRQLSELNALQAEELKSCKKEYLIMKEKYSKLQHEVEAVKATMELLKAECKTNAETVSAFEEMNSKLSADVSSKTEALQEHIFLNKQLEESLKITATKSAEMERAFALKQQALIEKHEADLKERDELHQHNIDVKNTELEEMKNETIRLQSKAMDLTEELASVSDTAAQVTEWNNELQLQLAVKAGPYAEGSRSASRTGSIETSSVISSAVNTSTGQLPAVDGAYSQRESKDVLSCFSDISEELGDSLLLDGEDNFVGSKKVSTAGKRFSLGQLSDCSLNSSTSRKSSV
eukprot:Nk52_evm42s1073 gene=Nk52_evmTU42s1073